MRTLLELGENTLGTKQSKKSNTPTLAKRKKERKKKKEVYCACCSCSLAGSE